MFELSEAELQALEELWNLIQTKRSSQGIASEDFSGKPSSTLLQQLDDPLSEDQMRVLRHRFVDRT